jgi:hypothetical protein
MTVKEETFNEFLMSVCDPDDWDKEIWPTIYGRMPEMDLPWKHMDESPDPYDKLSTFVDVGLHHGFAAMLLMYGKMTRLNDDDSPTEEVVRVRVMIYFDGEEPVVAVQPRGETVWITEDMGAGMMAEAIQNEINSRRSMGMS